MRQLPAELRGAVRALARSPLFASVAILSLGLALALNTTMFGLVDAILHPPIAYPAPDRLYTVRFLGEDPRKIAPPELKLAAVREGVSGIEGFALNKWHAAQVVAGDEATNDLVSMVSPEFFAVAGVKPRAGRTFGPDAVGHHEAVIEFALWRRLFAERPVASGLTVEIDDQPFTVVGVMPPGMRLGVGSVWVPMGSLPTSPGRELVVPEMVMRVKPGVTRERVETELAVASRRLQAEYGSKPYPLAARLWNVQEQETPKLNDFHRLLLAVVAGILAIASANLATLLLARGAQRRRATAVRLAIGASRWAVARVVMLECALIALGGAAVGLVLSYWSMQIVAHWAPRHVPQLGEFVPTASARIFVFAFCTALVVMLVAGVMPALRASRVPPAEPLKDGGGSTRRRRDRYSVLVVAEIALSTALLMLAALATMSTWRLARHEFGFDASRVVRADVNMNARREREMRGAAAARLRAAAVERLRGTPGVRDAASVRSTQPTGLMVLGENGAAGERWINLRFYQVVSPAYLRTLGMPIVDGRDFSEGDAAGTTPVAIVDQDVARRLWPEYASPVGRMLKLGGGASDAPWVRVIGVSARRGNAPSNTTRDVARLDVYVVAPDDETPPGSFVVSTSTRHDAALPLAIRRTLRSTIGEFTWATVEPFSARFDEMLRFTGFLSMLLCALSAFALVLCAVGLYGVLAVTVSERMRELAIRIALGARVPTVARLVARDAVVMALAGVAIGAFIALGATAGMAADLLEIRFAHAKALIAAEAVLLLVVALAAWEPVRRGTRADPATMLQAS